MPAPVTDGKHKPFPASAWIRSPGGLQVGKVDDETARASQQLGRLIAEKFPTGSAGEREPTVGSYSPKPPPGRAQDRVHVAGGSERLDPITVLLPNKVPDGMKDDRKEQDRGEGGHPGGNLAAAPRLKTKQARQEY